MDTRAKLAELPAELRAEVLARAHGRLDELEATSQIERLDTLIGADGEEAGDGRNHTEI